MAKKTAVFLTTTAAEEYVIGTTDGVRSALAARGYNLVLASATMQGFDHLRLDHLRAAFLTACAADYDAYIVLAGVIRHRAREARMSADSLFDLLPRDKTLILEDNIDGFRCLYKNNVPGMREIMAHVLDECGCERVGFVSGPVTSYGAREREAVYHEEMAKRGLRVESKWFARGIFRGGPQELIDEYVSRNLDLDAIMCATDQLAINVYRALEKYHLRPGVDVFVTGHDDQPCASVANPPLTTVSLVPFDFGYVAGQEAANIIEGKPQDCMTVGGHLLIRTSCGEKPTDDQAYYRQLITASPFDARAIALFMLGSCAKEPLVRGDSPYLDDLEAMIVMAHNLTSGFGRGVDTAEFLSSERLGRLAQATELGELRMDELQATLDDYLITLISQASGHAASNITKLMVAMDQTFMRYVNSNHYQGAPRDRAREIATGCIVDAGLLATDTEDLITRLMRGIAGTGLAKTQLSLCVVPLSCEDRDFMIPETLQLVGQTVGASVELASSRTVSTSDALRMAPTSASALPQTYAMIGLHRGKKFYGCLVAELGTISFSQFHIISLAVSHALRIWHHRQTA